MADKDGDGPSLELPSLGFGRKRGKKARRANEDETTTAETAPTPVEPAPEPVAAPEPEPAPVEPEPAEAETTVVEARPEPPTAQMPAAAAAPPPPAREPRSAPAAAQPAAPPLFADEAHDRPVPSLGAHTEDRGTAEEKDAESKPRRRFSLPAVSGMTAALITGAVVGGLMVGLTGIGFRLCEIIQGTSSCGDPGFLLLLAIVIVVVVLGKTLLAAWSVTDPGSTSFLAVGLTCVVALLFLVDVLFNWWMIIVIPVVSMVCFALSHWVTTAFVDSDE